MSTRQRTSTKSGFRVPLKEGKATPTIHPCSAGGGWGHYRTQFIENKKENPKRLARFSFFSLSQSPQHNATCSQKAQQISIDCKGASDYPSAGQPQNHTASDSSKTPRSKATTAKITT